MTPKQKAKQLIEKFGKVECLKDFDGMYPQLAKECALIAADEILSILDAYFISAVNYWKVVKQEIEKL